MINLWCINYSLCSGVHNTAPNTHTTVDTNLLTLISFLRREQLWWQCQPELRYPHQQPGLCPGQHVWATSWWSQCGRSEPLSGHTLSPTRLPSLPTASLHPSQGQSKAWPVSRQSQHRVEWHPFSTNKPSQAGQWNSVLKASQSKQTQQVTPQPVLLHSIGRLLPCVYFFPLYSVNKHHHCWLELTA